MTWKHMALILAFIVGFLGYEVTKPACGQTYAVASVASYHFDRSKKRNEENWGLGFEHGVTADTRLVAGFYRNSNYLDSTYVGAAWLPLRAGNWRFGAFGGAFTGYDIDIKWGLLPIAAYEHPNGWGANFTLAPTVGSEKTSYVAGLQLKYRIK